MARISKIQFRRGTSAQWANVNPVLAAGEPAYETDTMVIKIGDGTTAYNSLPPLNLTSGTPTTGSGYRKAIIIDHSNVLCNLPNFPVLVKITNDSNIGARSRADGYDIRFALNDNTNLDYERVSFDITNNVCNAVFWVRVPLVTCETDTTFFIKYGTETTDGENAVGVWDSNFTRVYHLEETGAATAGDYKDSTSNNCVSTNTTTQPTRAAGKIGYGQDFNGTSNKISLTLPALSVENNFTISWWGKGVGQGVMGGWGASKVVVSNTYFGIYGVYNSVTRQYTFTPTNFAPSDAFNRFALVKQDSNLFGYLNGELVAYMGVDAATKLSFAVIGANEYWEEFFDGILDEIFISNTNRSVEWIYAEYMNMNIPTTFLAFGAETIY